MCFSPFACKKTIALVISMKLACLNNYAASMRVSNNARAAITIYDNTHRCGNLASIHQLN